MYQFVDILLLALFAAALVDAGLALRAVAPGTGRLRRAFATLWHTDHLLFGDWAAPARLKAGPALLAAGLGAYELSVCLCNSLARVNWPWLETDLAPFLDLIVCVCFGAKILGCTRYTWRSLGVAGCLYFIGRWVFLNSQNIWWIGILLAVMAAKDVPLALPLRIYLWVGSATMAVLAALNLAGIVVPPALSEREGVFRSAYGYGHPNTFGGLFLGLMLAYALLHARRLRWRDLGVLSAGGIFLLIGPASRSAGLTCLLLVVLLALYKVRPRLYAGRALPALGAVLVPLAAAVSCLLPLLLVKNGPWNNDFGPDWLSWLDRALTCRLSLTWTCYRLFTIKIAGQVLPSWPALDNSFAFSLYQFGPVATLLWGGAVALAIYGMAKLGRVPEFCCLLAMLVYAFMEMQSFHLTTNPTALLLCGAMFALPRAEWPDILPAAKQ